MPELPSKVHLHELGHRGGAVRRRHPHAGSTEVTGGQVTPAGNYAATGTTVTGGTASFASSATTGTLAQSGGTLVGSAGLTVTGAATLSGGRQTGSGTDDPKPQLG